MCENNEIDLLNEVGVNYVTKTSAALLQAEFALADVRRYLRGMAEVNSPAMTVVHKDGVLENYYYFPGIKLGELVGTINEAIETIHTAMASMP